MEHCHFSGSHLPKKDMDKINKAVGLCEKTDDKSTHMSEIDGKIVLDPTKVYAMPIKNGHLDIRVSTDPSYPGIDIEYISDKEAETPDDKLKTRPRVLVENNENVLRAVVWGDQDSEDYSDAIDFTCLEDMVE